MKRLSRLWILLIVFAAALGAAPASALDDKSPIIAEDATRYMALGDSLAAGYLALPVTKGYTYRLYDTGSFDAISHTLFCNAAVPGASSSDVLMHQVPQALIRSANGGFAPKYVTLTVGGNDLLSILHYIQTNPDPSTVVPFATQVINVKLMKVGGILAALRVLNNAMGIRIIDGCAVEMW